MHIHLAIGDHGAAAVSQHTGQAVLAYRENLLEGYVPPLHHCDDRDRYFAERANTIEALGWATAAEAGASLRPFLMTVSDDTVTALTFWHDGDFFDTLHLANVVAVTRLQGRGTPPPSIMVQPYTMPANAGENERPLHTAERTTLLDHEIVSFDAFWHSYTSGDTSSFQSLVDSLRNSPSPLISSFASQCIEAFVPEEDGLLSYERNMLRCLKACNEGQAHVDVKALNSAAGAMAPVTDVLLRELWHRFVPHSASTQIPISIENVIADLRMATIHHPINRSRQPRIVG